MSLKNNYTKHNSQKNLYALNTKNKTINLAEDETATLENISIEDIIKDGTLEHITSTYDRDDGVIRDRFQKNGPHLITFAGILKYNIFPLADILKDLLSAGQQSMGSPVEIEFAVNLNLKGKKPPTFSIIQIRPFVISQEHANILWEEEDIFKENVLIHSKKALGNGIIEGITDIVYVSPKTFDSTKMIEIAHEVGKLNQKIKKPYILIGPGRWGTQDRFLGVPVRWSEISNVKVMVETSLKDFNIKPSQGTHFFQNIICQGVGYINVSLKPGESKIDWKWLDEIESKEQMEYVKHISLSKPLIIKIDGRQGLALIQKP